MLDLAGRNQASDRQFVAAGPNKLLGVVEASNQLQSGANADRQRACRSRLHSTWPDLVSTMSSAKSLSATDSYLAAM